ncbi:PaaI family thioesterase [Macrococcus caseolyticus]|nr:PaaI family thioesterase [Macrococcus caseolyticus]RKO10780.1 PaaI family thioesterase [Macrococcus caseolyticus]
MKVLDVSLEKDGSLTVSFQVHTIPKLTNTMKMVHGGASSTLISTFTVLALAGDKKYWKNPTEPTNAELEAFYNDLGYTRTLNIQIIQAVPLNTDVTVRCRVVSNTKSNAYIIGGIHNQGRTLVNGIHDMTKRSLASRDPMDPSSLRADFQLSRL